MKTVNFLILFCLIGCASPEKDCIAIFDEATKTIYNTCMDDYNHMPFIPYRDY